MILPRWLQDQWSKIKGRFLHRQKARKESQREVRPVANVPNTVNQRPPKRARTQTSAKAITMQFGLPSASPKSKLLSLPAEVRLLIWEYTFGGNLIALYRVHRRLTHALLGDHNSLATIDSVAICTETTERALRQLPRTTREDPKRISSSKKLGVLAALQSCRLIYSEGSELLYSCNKFLFLQNLALQKFQISIHPYRFAALRSIHLHWQYDETNASTVKGFGKSLSLLSTSMITQLDCISIFMQGLVRLEESYPQILSDVKNFRPLADSPTPKIFVLRLPHRHRDLNYLNIRHLICDASLPFQIMGSGAGWPELTGGGGHGWKHGVACVSPDGRSDGSRGFVMKRYMVWVVPPWKLT